MTPTLGEFLTQARWHITAVAGHQDGMPASAIRSVITELGRVTVTLEHYFADVTEPGVPAAARADLTTATLAARRALYRAAASLRGAANAAGAAGLDADHPASRHLAAAASLLAAGRDLLQTHFTTGADGIVYARSWQAPLITSAPVTAVLAADLAGHARQLAPWASRLAFPAHGDHVLPGPARLALHEASHWLLVAGTTMEAATRGNPPATADRELLHAIPANTPPPRHQPSGTETIPELCDGATATAERLRHASRRFAPRARWSPAATATSWRRDAQAAAITSHSSELILRALASQAAPLGASTEITASLRDAADATARAQAAWRTVTDAWDTITTSRHPLLTPVAAEIGDLVLWTGRLAYATPQWTPARGCQPQPRTPADLAPTYRDMLDVLAAVHHASDTLTRIGVTDRRAIRDAAIDQRLHVATRSRPEDCDIPYPYAPAPVSRVKELLCIYDSAVNASKEATAILDNLATALHAPSRMLTAARAAQSRTTQRGTARHASRARAHGPAGSPSLPAARAEEAMRSLQISDPEMLVRAIAADEATNDLIAEASIKSRKRTTTSLPTCTPGNVHASDRPARLAAQDLPSGPGPLIRTPASNNPQRPATAPSSKAIRQGQRRHTGS